MRWTFWRRAVARALFGIVLPVATGSAALANGLIDPNVRWDHSVVRCNYPCPQQPCDCLPCDPQSSSKTKSSTSAPDPAESSTDGAKGQTESSTAPSDDQLAYSPPTNYSNVASGAQNVSADDAGYLDWARIATRLRVRYDDMRGANKPTRAEYFYPTPAPGPGPAIGGGGGGAGGEVDFRALETYLEVALGPEFSVFVEAPVRWVDDVGTPGNTQTTDGFGDIKAGVRYALYHCCDEWLTVQLRSWSPTGDARQALGVGHSTLDLALLYQNRLNYRTQYWWEIDDWQSLDAMEDVTINGVVTDLNANVLQYGFGIGYDICQTCECRPKTLTGVFEVVSWTVLDGVVTDVTGAGIPPQDASGDTIVNGKYGLRYKWANETAYIGYGHNWTTDRWYSDILRLEFTHYF